MKEYLCVMTTARGCGHCAHSRGNGVMGSGAHFMKPSVIDEFLSLGDNFSFLNIHFDSMSGKRQLIREISKFYKEGDTVIEEMWAIEGEGTRYFRVEANTKTKEITQSGNDNINKDWIDFVKSKVPLNIENYTYYYPCFMITKTDNWLNSINNNAELYALTNAGKTKIQNGKVFLDKDGKSFNERMVDPKDLVKNVITGKEKIEPHIKETKTIVEKPKPKSKEEPKPKKTELPKHTTNNYIIRQY